MSKKPYARITITLPEDDLASADRLAAAQDRSRSWIIAEALRRYAAEHDVVDPLGAQRRAQLLADQALTPEARVHVAEAVARQTDGAGTPLRLATYDEFRALRRTAGQHE